MEDFPDELLNQAKTYFQKYDVNNNGAIEFKELRTLMIDISKEIGIPSPSDDDVAKVMDDTDVNKDQKIFLDEFLSLFKIIYVMKNMNN